MVTWQWGRRKARGGVKVEGRRLIYFHSIGWVELVCAPPFRENVHYCTIGSFFFLLREVPILDDGPLVSMSLWNSACWNGGRKCSVMCCGFSSDPSHVRRGVLGALESGLCFVGVGWLAGVFGQTTTCRV